MSINSAEFKGKNKKKKGKCFKCNREGHWAEDCYAKTAVATTSKEGKYKGKGKFNNKKNWKGKGKKRWVRVMEGEEEVEEEEDDDDEDQEEIDINFVDNMRSTLSHMSTAQRNDFFNAMQKDFQ